MSVAPRGKPRDARIAIVGAGPAGLGTAWFLRQHGFKRVTVFEERGRVGGLCNTLTEDYRSFDLGANYITASYRETRKLAREVGARCYRARPWIGVRVPPGTHPEGDAPSQKPLEYLSMFEVVREIRNEKGDVERRVGLVALARAILRYIWKRFRLRSVLDVPTFEHIDDHPELCVSFQEWLKRENLDDLRALFEIPITLMGYGYLREIAAPYALRFLSLGLFIPLVLRQAWPIGLWFRWPKRFVFGFQRMFEVLSWRLNVRLNVHIRRIERSESPDDPHPIRIEFEHPERVFGSDELDCDELWFDYLIVACTRTGSLGRRLDAGSPPEIQCDIRPEEHDLFKDVDTHRFCVTTLHTKPNPRFRPPRPVVCAIPFTDDTTTRPWVLVQLWGDQSDMIQCYTKLPKEPLATPAKSRRPVTYASKVLPGVIDLIRLLGGDVYPVEGFGGGSKEDLKLQRWVSYMEWPYFGHVTPEAMRGGWFQRLEELQGRHRTYWVGGATNFEAVEPILVYAKHLVERHFVAGHANRPSMGT